MTAPATMIILVVTALATFRAFQRPDLQERWIFDPRAILAHREYYRMFTCGLIHADWTHFAFNAFSFYSFARNLEFIYGARTMLLIYGSAIFGGSVLSLVIQRHHEYRALGASGGVCGILFASIFLLPGNAITLFLLPVPVPAYVYAILFLIGSYMAHRRQSDNIGHDAHLGGAIVGLLVAAALYPQLIQAAPRMFAGVLLLSLTILAFLIFDPLQLWNLRLGVRVETDADAPIQPRRPEITRDHKLAELDRLLDQVSRDGLKSLSSAQRKKLEQLSREVYGRDKDAKAP